MRFDPQFSLFLFPCSPLGLNLGLSRQHLDVESVWLLKNGPAVNSLKPDNETADDVDALLDTESAAIECVALTDDPDDQPEFFWPEWRPE